MKKKKSNFVINILVILIVLCLVLYFSLKDDYLEIINDIINMNKWCVLGAILCLVICRVLISVVHYMVINLNGEKVSFTRCLQINFIILFFHGITPFAGGGQPMEVYYLHNEKIPVTKATNITLQNFIVYQISFVLIGLCALLYNSKYHLYGNNHLIKHLVILGFIINILVLVITFFLSFAKRANKYIINKLVEVFYKMKIIKDDKAISKKLNEYLDSFYKNAVVLGHNKLKLFFMILIDFIAVFVLYSMPFFVALGFGVKLSIIPLVVTTTYVMTIGSFVPIPGGTGGVEYGFIFFFGYLIRGSVVNAIMLIWRFVSYYLGMIFGAIFLSLYRKRENK